MSDLHLSPPSSEPHPTMVTVTGTAVLLTISGPDRPGVSRAFFSALDLLPILVLDVEQVVNQRAAHSGVPGVSRSGYARRR